LRRWEEKMSKFERRLQEEAEKIEKAEEAKLKTLAELLSEEEGPREAYVPELGCKIRFYDLRFGDYPAIAEEKDPFKLALKVLLATWGRADSTVTEENLMKLGLTKCVSIINALGLGRTIAPLQSQTRT
jgi:hypothetical protein